MLKLFLSLVFFLLARLSAAQFSDYPTCVQPLLTKAFPARCLSQSLAAQNTCLCKGADAAASTVVRAIYQACGCAALEQTIQLSDAYCNQVDIDIGPAYSVYIEDDTPCGSSTGSGTSTGTGSGTSTETGTGSGTSTNTGSGTNTNTGSGTNTGTGTVRTSGANKGLVNKQIFKIVVLVAGGILSLGW
jgi:hypothetical protein